MNDTRSLVINIVAEQMGVAPGELTPATSFVDDLGADSLDTVELTMEIEEVFDITVPDEIAATLLTIGDVINYIEDPESYEDEIEDGDESEEDDAEDDQAPGGGFVVDPVKRGAIEQAAVGLATRWYESRGWTVRSVEHVRDVVGYDLDCTLGDQVEHVEVKGTAGREEAFIITEAEKRLAEIDPRFHLVIVTDALGEPSLARYRGREAFEALCLQADRV